MAVYNRNVGYQAERADLGRISTFVPEIVGVRPDVVAGGPCQDFSSAGSRKEGALSREIDQMIANAVPPPLAETVGRTMLEGEGGKPSPEVPGDFGQWVEPARKSPASDGRQSQVARETCASTAWGARPRLPRERSLCVGGSYGARKALEGQKSEAG